MHLMDVTVYIGRCVCSPLGPTRHRRESRRAGDGDMLRLFRKILGKGEVDCGEVRKNASDYLEQSLPSDRLAAIRAHLAGCGPCRSFIDTLSATIGLLSRIPPVTVPEGFRETVMRRVQREG